MEENGEHTNSNSYNEMQKDGVDAYQKQNKKKRNYSQTFNVTKEFHKTSNFETVQTYKKGGGTFSLLKFEPLAKLKPTTSNIRIVPKSLEHGSTIQSKQQETSPTILKSDLDPSGRVVEANHASKTRHSPTSSFFHQPSPLHALPHPIHDTFITSIISDNSNYSALNARLFSSSTSQYSKSVVPQLHYASQPALNSEQNNSKTIASDAFSPQVPLHDRMQSAPFELLKMQENSSALGIILPHNSKSPKETNLPSLQSSKKRKMDLDFILNKE